MRKLWACALVAWLGLGATFLTCESVSSRALETAAPTPSVIDVGIRPSAEVKSQRKTVSHKATSAAPERAAKAKRAAKKAKPAKKKAKVAAAPQGRKIKVTAYAYCLRGRTASGAPTGPGCVAVDTGLIPLGAKLYIPGYGWGKAMDTGGGIYGRKIDIWLPTERECLQWGVRDVTITVVD